MYSRILQSVLLPVYYNLRGRNYSRYRKLVEESQWWSADRLREFQWREAGKLLKHCFESVPYYQKKFAEAGVQWQDIRTPADLVKLPPLDRSEVNAHREELKSTAFRGKFLPHSTGGSSGVPTRFYITHDSFDWRMAVSARAYSWSGCNLGDRTAFLWGAPVGKQSKFSQYKVGLYRRARRELIFNTFTQYDELWKDIYEALKSYRPRLIVGYVSSIEGFCRFLLNRNLTFEHRAEAVIAAAEPVFSNTRELVASALGAPLFNTYGSREFMSIGGECSEHDGLHLNVENLLLETEEPAESGPSEILVTDLHNFGMPFVRYRIGDVGRLRPWEKCACGRGLPKLDSIEGRVLDVLRTRDGRVVPGELFPHVMKDVPEVLEFQVRQTSLDEIVLQVVLGRPMSSRSLQLLNGEFTKFFGSGTKITIQEVPSIARRSSGKRRVTVGLSG